jgi:hypothetical protein
MGKKNAFLRVYFIFNRDLRIDYKVIESTLFRYLFKIPLNIFSNMILIIKNRRKEKKERTFYVRNKSLIKNLLKDVVSLTEEEFNMAWNFKIKIYKEKIKTNGFMAFLKDIIKSTDFIKLNTLYYLKDGSLIQHLGSKNSLGFVSLTSSKSVRYMYNINQPKYVQTNFLGKQPSGKNQYGLLYEKGEDFDKKFLIDDRININLLKSYEIHNKKSMIGFMIKYHIAILSKDE